MSDHEGEKHEGMETLDDALRKHGSVPLDEFIRRRDEAHEAEKAKLRAALTAAQADAAALRVALKNIRTVGNQIAADLAAEALAQPEGHTPAPPGPPGKVGEPGALDEETLPVTSPIAIAVDALERHQREPNYPGVTVALAMLRQAVVLDGDLAARILATIKCDTCDPDHPGQMYCTVEWLPPDGREVQELEPCGECAAYPDRPALRALLAGLLPPSARATQPADCPTAPASKEGR